MCGEMGLSAGLPRYNDGARIRWVVVGFGYMQFWINRFVPCIEIKWIGLRGAK